MNNFPHHSRRLASRLGGEPPRSDWLRSGVHLLLTLYLLPAVLAVLLVSGLLALIVGLTRLCGAFANLIARILFVRGPFVRVMAADGTGRPADLPEVHGLPRRKRDFDPIRCPHGD
jgi:hypothetical protein